MDKSQGLIILYEEKSYSKLIDIYNDLKSKIDIQNIVWIILKNKNKTFVNKIFKQNKSKFDVKQLGCLKDCKFINLKYIIQEAEKRINNVIDIR